MRSVMLAALLLALVGCTGSPPPEIDAWMIRRDAAPAEPKNRGALPVRLSKVAVASHIDGIVVIRADGRVETLFFHRWAAPVGEMVREWLRSRLSESPNVGGVLQPGDPGSTPSLSLTVEVRRFEFEERGEDATARVELWAVIAAPAFDVRVVGPIVGVAPAVIAEASGLPRAMSAALAQAVESLMLEVRAAAESANR